MNAVPPISTSRPPARSRTPRVELDAATVRAAVDEAGRLHLAKAARVRLAVRALGQARADLQRTVRSRDSWRRVCCVGWGLLAITWGTAAALRLLVGS